MTVTYSIFLPVVPGISDLCKGCHPDYFLHHGFDDEYDFEYRVKYTIFKGYEGYMISGESRDSIWVFQDNTDHGHGGISEEYRQELIDINSWTDEDQFYYEYRLILDDINDGLN